MYIVDFFGKTNVGLRRKNNEDTFCAQPELGFYLVADGMGGAAAGEFASGIFADTAMRVFSNLSDSPEVGKEPGDGWDQMTVELCGNPCMESDEFVANESEDDHTRKIFKNRVFRTHQETVNLIQRSFDLANENILAHVRKNTQHEGMGCTAELMALSVDGFALGHVGDSRSYLYRDGVLHQLTKDHSLIQNQIDQGFITESEAWNHPLRNIISRAIGIKPELSPDIISGRVFPGDQFLFCSDGLTDLVQDDLILENLSSSASVRHKVETLIQLANSAGGKDNITVVISIIL